MAATPADSPATAAMDFTAAVAGMLAGTAGLLATAVTL